MTKITTHGCVFPQSIHSCSQQLTSGRIDSYMLKELREGTLLRALTEAPKSFENVRSFAVTKRVASASVGESLEAGIIRAAKNNGTIQDYYQVLYENLPSHTPGLSLFKLEHQNVEEINYKYCDAMGGKRQALVYAMNLE